MNDFTKEDLKILLRQMCYSAIANEQHKTIYDKIKLMIDKYEAHEYCEHSGVKLGAGVDEEEMAWREFSAKMGT